MPVHVLHRCDLFSNIFDPHLVESLGADPTGRGGQLHSRNSLFPNKVASEAPGLTLHQHISLEHTVHSVAGSPASTGFGPVQGLHTRDPFFPKSGTSQSTGKVADLQACPTVDPRGLGVAATAEQLKQSPRACCSEQLRPR